MTGSAPPSAVHPHCSVIHTSPFHCPHGQGDSMPLSINVGLSRKDSKDYQSTGVSINVSAELDQALLARPQELQKQIDALYGQAASALDRHAGAPAEAQPQTRRPATTGA